MNLLTHVFGVCDYILLEEDTFWGIDISDGDQGKICTEFKIKLIYILITFIFINEVSKDFYRRGAHLTWALLWKWVVSSLSP